MERSRRPKARPLEQKFPKLSEWLRDQSRPTLRQLEALAKASSTPLGYLFLPEPPVERLPIPHFRTAPTEAPAPPTPDLLETVQMMERRQAWMREYVVEQEEDPLPFVRSAGSGDDPKRVAHAMRHTLGLGEGWAAKHPTWSDALDGLRSRMEDAGILVVVNGIVGNNTRRKLSPAEFRGFVLVDEYAPLVFVNGADYKAARMFTLAHELAHVWLGSSAAFDLRDLQPASDVTEQACNQVAAEFLVPGEQLRDLWRSIRNDPDPWQSIAREFKVSALVAARRALDLGLITRDGFLEFYGHYLEDERRTAARRQEGGNFYATQNLRIGKLFGETVVRAAKEGRLLYREAYQLTGLYGRVFTRYADLLRSGRFA
jgi:Zn-dependent peptidase ImmA (M78 family)